jgi:hypothetical protein
VHSKGWDTDSMAWRQEVEGGAECAMFQGGLKCTAGHKPYPGTSFSEVGIGNSMEKTRIEQHSR